MTEPGPGRTTTRILVVEDEPDMAAGLGDNLQFEGYEVLIAPDGEAALEVALGQDPALVILDVMLPGMSGFETCSALRKRGFRAPILMLSARAQEIDKVRGLELGADDYITKPFSVAELMARIKAALRRSADDSDAEFVNREIEVGVARVSLAKSTVVRGRKEFALGHYESEILKILMENPGSVVARTALLGEIWGVENEPMNRSVDNHIVSLRRKIESDPARPKHILTVHGFGYKFIP